MWRDPWISSGTEATGGGVIASVFDDAVIMVNS